MPWHNATTQHMNDDKRSQKNRHIHSHHPKKKNSNKRVKLLYIFFSSSSYYYSYSCSSFSYCLCHFSVRRWFKVTASEKKAQILMGKMVYAKCEQMTSSPPILPNTIPAAQKKYGGSIFNLMRTCFFVSSLLRLLWMECSVWKLYITNE